jgi:hypothetical protein
MATNNAGDLQGPTNFFGSNIFAGTGLSVERLPNGKIRLNQTGGSGFNLWTNDNSLLHPITSGLSFSVGEGAFSGAAVAGYAELFNVGDYGFLSAAVTNNDRTFAMGSENYSTAVLNDNTLIFAFGDANLSTAAIRDSHDIFGFGTLTLADVNINDGNFIYAFGDAAMRANAITNSDFLYAYGSEPFRLSTVINSREVHAYGLASLRSSAISGSSNIFAYGYDVLKNARLTNSANIFAFGRAAGTNMAGSFTNVMLFGNVTPANGTANQFIIAQDLPVSLPGLRMSSNNASATLGALPGSVTRLLLSAENDTFLRFNLTNSAIEIVGYAGGIPAFVIDPGTNNYYGYNDDLIAYQWLSPLSAVAAANFHTVWGDANKLLAGIRGDGMPWWFTNLFAVNGVTNVWPTTNALSGQKLTASVAGGTNTFYWSDDAGGTTINATDGFLPYRSSSTTFADSPLQRVNATTIGLNGATNNLSTEDYTLTYSAPTNSQLRVGQGPTTVSLGVLNTVAKITSSLQNIYIAPASASANLLVSSAFNAVTADVDDTLDLGLSSSTWRSIYLARTNAPLGTTGNAAMHKTSGRVRLAAAATQVFVTNTLVTANSRILATVTTNDATAKSVSAIPSMGLIQFNLNAAATGETPVDWLVLP